MAKRKVVYDSDGDGTEDISKKARRPSDQEQDDSASVRRSERTGRGSGGRLTQMKNIERVQTEPPKRPSAVDVATQGEELNPMAPFSQDSSRSGSRKGRATSCGTDIQTYPQPAPLQSLQPGFTLAAPGQQFGFRLPDSVPTTEKNAQAPVRTRTFGAPSQALSNRGSSVPWMDNGTQAPVRARFSASQASSQDSATSSLYSSFLSGRSSAGASTAPTSRAPSVCSSSDGRRIAQQRHFSASQSHSSASLDPIFADPGPTMSSSTHLTDNNERNHAPAKLQRTASFYDRPFHIDQIGHSLSAAPETDQFECEIDEVSPSDDDRFAEAMLRRDNETISRPDIFSRTSLSPADDDADGTSVDRATEERQQSRPAPHTLDRTPGNGGGVEDVVTVHRQRNRAPHLPSNVQLLAARQRQASSVDQVSGEASHNGDNQEPIAATKTSQVPRSSGSEPWQLQFYDPPTRDVIERAKQFSHCDAASVNAFPVRAPFNSKAVEYIEEAIIERQSRGLVVSDGWWPKYASDLARLLWEDLGSWRSAMRKKARTFVTQRYQWDPENRRDRNIEIAKNLLGNGGLFLRDGTDEEGHANNLAHPALSGLIIDFFYSGPTSVGKLFPEVFLEEVPRVTVAIAATAVVLDEMASGGEVNFRVNTYMPVYNEILGLMNKCDTSPVHREKTMALRRRWARHGSNGMTIQEQPSGGCGFDVDLG